MNIRPKVFVAVRRFSCAGARFAPGDEVPRSIALESSLRYGDRFVTPGHRPDPVTPPPVDLDPDPTTSQVDVDVEDQQE